MADMTPQQFKAFKLHSMLCKRKRDILHILREANRPLSIDEIRQAKRVDPQAVTIFRIKKDLDDLIEIGLIVQVENPAISEAMAAQFGPSYLFTLNPYDQY